LTGISDFIPKSGAKSRREGEIPSLLYISWLFLNLLGELDLAELTFHGVLPFASLGWLTA
jgi:hypothetical protein